MKYLTISPTSFDNLEECLAKLFYRKERKIIFPSSSTHMSMGHLGHYGLETYYKLKMERPRIPAVELIERTGLALREESLGYNTLGPDEKAQIFDAVRDYIIHYIGETWEPVDVERPFSKVLIEIPGMDLTVVLEGKIDLRFSLDGRIRVADHKFKWQKWAMSSLKNQYMAYAVASDSPVVIDNSIYLYKAGPKFERTTFSYDKERMEEWVRETVPYHIKRLVQAYQDGYWPQSWTACDKFGGCAYRSICEAPKSIRESIIKSDYVPYDGSDLYD
jgi:hypothetical protein